MCGELSRPIDITLVECDACDHRIGQGAERVLGEVRRFDRRECLLRELGCAMPVVALDRDDAPFRERDGHRPGCARRVRGVDRVGQDRVGAICVTFEEEGHCLEHEHHRTGHARRTEALARDRGLRQEVGHAVSTQQHAHPGLEARQRAAVGKHFVGGGRLDRGRPSFGCERLAVERVHERAQCRGRGVPVEVTLALEPTQPAVRGLGPTLRVGGLGPQEHEAGGAVDVAAGLGVFDGHLEFAVRFAPGRGPPVQHDLDLGFAPLQLGAQQIAEQPVVPVPLAPPIQRDEQEVRPFERLEHARRSRSRRAPRRTSRRSCGRAPRCA